mmetsp:Transcript_10848/g.46241  ORF Transcript_10848/g.46241 Transcript_10848/m.46241 type:complete len:368 (+) Transcript_10848:1088-2191(+)
MRLPLSCDRRETRATISCLVAALAVTGLPVRRTSASSGKCSSESMDSHSSIALSARNKPRSDANGARASSSSRDARDGYRTRFSRLPPRCRRARFGSAASVSTSDHSARQFPSRFKASRPARAFSLSYPEAEAEASAKRESSEIVFSGDADDGTAPRDLAVALLAPGRSDVSSASGRLRVDEVTKKAENERRAISVATRSAWRRATALFSGFGGCALPAALVAHAAAHIAPCALMAAAAEATAFALEEREKSGSLRGESAFSALALALSGDDFSADAGDVEDDDAAEPRSDDRAFPEGPEGGRDERAEDEDDAREISAEDGIARGGGARFGGGGDVSGAKRTYAWLVVFRDAQARENACPDEKFWEV